MTPLATQAATAQRSIHPGQQDEASRGAISRFGSWCAERFASHETLYLTAIVAVYFGVSIVSAARRPLWFDELSTLTIASVPGIAAMLHALPTDGNPPLDFLLVKLSIYLFGPTELAVRLPSIAAMIAASAAIYWFTRRHVQPIFSLLAAVLFAGSEAGRFAATEGRPYALLLAFTGLALVSWQAAAESRRPRWPIVGIAAGFAGAICSHHYGVIYIGVPLLAGEAVRWWKSRRLDTAVFCASATGVLVLPFTLRFVLQGPQPLVIAAIKQSSNFWARPHLADLWFYLNMLPAFFPLILAAALLLLAVESSIAAPRRRQGQPSAAPPPTSADTLPRHEVAAVLALFLLLPIMLVVTKLTSGYFMARYAAGTAMGMAILTGLYLPRFAYTKKFAVPLAALCTLYVVTVPLLSLPLLLAIHADVNPAAWIGAALRSAPQDEPVVIASALRFFPDRWYASPALRNRMHYLADIPYAVRQPDFYPEYTLVLERPYNGVLLDEYQPFLRTHSRFLVYGNGEPRLEWLMGRLASDGFRLTRLKSEGNQTLYQAERMMNR